MNSMNLVGRMTADAETKTTPSGVSVCTFTMAVNRPRVKGAVDFIPCVAWKQAAEYLGKYAHKGDIVSVSGFLNTREYEDKNGNKRKSFEIVVDFVSIVSFKAGKEVKGPGAEVGDELPL